MVEQLDRIVEEQIGESPGLALAVIQDGAIVHMRGYGVTGIEDATLPVTPDTLFCIGSTSKVLTGTLVMRLVEAGLLDLDTSIASYVPWLRLSEPGTERIITLRHLLSHTSGLASAYTDYGPRDPAGLEAFVRDELPACRFVAPPGRVHFYSNAGIDLAGYVAEVVGSVYFPLLMHDQVFAPLGMRRSTYDRNVALTYPLALPHLRSTDGRLQVEHHLVDNVPGNPAGFAMSTVHDLAKLALMFLNGGSVDNQPFLRAESVEEMWRSHIDVYSLRSGRGYGLTFYTNMRHKGLRIVQHGGYMMSYACRFSLVPDARAAVIVLTNWSDNVRPIGNSVLDLICGQPAGPAYPPYTPAKPDRSCWSGYEGRYLNMEEGLAEIAVDEDRLTLRQNGGAQVTLEAVAGGYIAGDLEIAFVEGQDGTAEFLIIEEQPFRRLTEPLPTQGPDAGELDHYAGTYATVSTFEGPHSLIEFFVEDGRLHARRGQQQVACTFLGNTSFVSPWGLVTFEDGGARFHGSLRKERIATGV